MNTAALAYLVDGLNPLGGGETQKELAAEFQVSTSSLSSKYQDFKQVLAEEIESFYDTVDFELDDFFFDEDDD